MLGIKKLYSAMLVVTLFATTEAFSQLNKPSSPAAKKIDSLLAIIKTSSEDTTYVKNLNLLSRQYINVSEFTEAVKLAERSLGIGTKLSFKRGMATANNCLGIAYWNLGNYSRAENSFAEALKISESASDKMGMAFGYNSLGNVHSTLGNYETALNYFLKSLKIREELGDKSGIATAYVNMGNIYFNQQNYDKALDYYLKSLKISVELGDKDGQGTTLNNIGNIYASKGDNEKALEYFLRSLKICEELNDKRSVAMTYSNIGSIYSNLNDFEKALESQRNALKIQKEIGDAEGTSLANLNIGSVLVKQKKYAEALTYLELALQTCKSIGVKGGIKDAYAALSDLYSKTGDYQKAFEYQLLFAGMKDSLLSEASTKQITEMNAKYDSEKKDKELIKKDAEISIQHAESEKQNFQRNAFIAGFALVFLLAVFILRGYRQKQKANKLLDEKNMQITDSITYAQHIQEALMPPLTEIKSYLPHSFVLYIPKDIVSGDFYWLSPPRAANDNILLAAADCTGHGVPGAFMSVMGVNMLDSIVSEKKITQPALILDELNTVIVQTLHQESENSSAKFGMDIALLSINKNLNRVDYAGAHNSLLIVRDGKLIEHKANKTTIGMAQGKFTGHSVDVTSGDMLYIFTDGYADQKGGPENKKLFAAEFRELLVSVSKMNADEQKIELESLFHQRKGTNEQLDDVLVVGIKI